MSTGAEDLAFELPLLELERRIQDWEEFSRKSGLDLTEEIRKLREKSEKECQKIFADLTPWQRIQVARHPRRPDLLDYLNLLCDDHIELHGDRSFADDRAIYTGLARIGGERVMLIGHRKGRETQERIAHNFGSPHPEGYRKAYQKMKLAEKAGLPIVTLVNTPGAYPGIGAEERGQAWAIAENLYLMSLLRTPIVSVVIGEGGSGGALAICVADRLLILENAYLSVISPEGCAAILWRDSAKAPEAARLLRLTPQDLLRLGVVDGIIPEAPGGAHRNPKQTADNLRAAILRSLEELKRIAPEELPALRRAKYRRIGRFVEPPPQVAAPSAMPAEEPRGGAA